MRRRTQSLLKNAALASTGVALAISLSGCQKTDANLSVTSNDRVSGDLIYALSDDTWAFMAAMDPDGDGDVEEDHGQQKPMDVDTYITHVLGSQDMSAEMTASLPPRTRVEVHRAAGYSGWKITFDHATFRQFNKAMVEEEGNESLMSLRRVNASTVRFELPVPALDGGTLPAGSKPTYKAKMTFPGKVSATNGKLSGKTVTWQAKAGKKPKTFFAVARSRR